MKPSKNPVTAAVTAPPILRIPESPELAALIAAADAIAAEVADDAGSIDRVATRRATKLADLDAAIAAQGEADLLLAREVDESHALVLEARAKKATLAVDELRIAVGRDERTLDALKSELQKKIGRLDEQIKAVDVEISMRYRLLVTDAIDAAVGEAVLPLVEVMRQVAVVNEATNRGWFNTMLNDSTVPKNRGNDPHLGRGRHYGASGLASSLIPALPLDPELAALRDTAGAPTKRLRELTQALYAAKNPVTPEMLAKREREAKAQAEERALNEAEDRRREEIRRRGPTMKGYTVSDPFERQREETRRFIAQRDAAAPDFNSTARTPSPINDSLDHA